MTGETAGARLKPVRLGIPLSTMTDSSPDSDASTPVVLPRWEWRTFGDLQNGGEALDRVRGWKTHESDETYVLSHHGDGSVKIRDELMDTKTQRRVGSGGLQLWVPTMKAAFPLDAAELATMFAALGAPLPTLSRDSYTQVQARDRAHRFEP